MTDVAWVGLGAMGAPMARCLAQAGHQVRAFDADPSRIADLPPGMQAATSAADAVSGLAILFVMVATAGQAEKVLFGTDGTRGAVSALPAGATVVVMATVGVEAIDDWTGRLSQADIDLVDAPVSGGVARATSGDLLAMVSGAPAAVAKVAGLLDVMARNAPVVGSRPGDGQRFKLVNQLLCGVHIAAAAEALALAVSMGLDPRACWEVVRSGAAASFMLDDRGGRMLGEQPAPVRSAVNIFVKDMGLVLDAARAGGLPTPVAGAAGQLYLQASRDRLGGVDDSALMAYLLGEAVSSRAFP